MDEIRRSLADVEARGTRMSSLIDLLACVTS
jgi:hypothetical protein